MTQAELASMNCERAGLLEVAQACRSAAAELEARATDDLGPIAWSLVVAALFLFVALYLPW